MINILVLLALIALPFAGYHALVGGLLGLLEALAILIPLAKAPALVKGLVSGNPLMADVVFSALAAWGTASFFGTGLMLAVSVSVTAIILSLTLPRL